MIPKIIHYIWFGNLPEPEIVNDWKNKLPNYKINRWSEKDFDFDKYNFAKKAHELGKFGIAIDPFRAEILLKYGGIWLDTDVVINEDLEPFLNYSFFIGHEAYCKFSVGVIGVTANHALLLKISNWYATYWAKCNDNMTAATLEFYLRSNFTGPMVFTKLLQKEYNIISDGTSRTLNTEDGLIRLEAPPVFTIRGDYKVKNYAEHLYSSSWIENKSNFYKEIISWYNNTRAS